MSIFIIYRPKYSESKPYTVFKFMKEFREFLGDRLNKINMLAKDFNFHMEYEKGNEHLAVQDLLESSGLIQHVDCPTHQSGHTLDLIITKDKYTFSILEPVDKSISLTIASFIQV